MTQAANRTERSPSVSPDEPSLYARQTNNEASEYTPVTRTHAHETTAKKESKATYLRRRLAVGALAGLVVVPTALGINALNDAGGVSGVFENIREAGLAESDARYSDDIKQVQMEGGQGYHWLAGHIENFDQADLNQTTSYIMRMPENAEAVKDGLQAGESMWVPVSYDK